MVRIGDIPCIFSIENWFWEDYFSIKNQNCTLWLVHVLWHYGLGNFCQIPLNNEWIQGEWNLFNHLIKVKEQNSLSWSFTMHCFLCVNSMFLFHLWWSEGLPCCYEKCVNHTHQWPFWPRVNSVQMAGSCPSPCSPSGVLLLAAAAFMQQGLSLRPASLICF